jgi:Psb28 protein
VVVAADTALEVHPSAACHAAACCGRLPSWSAGPSTASCLFALRLWSSAICDGCVTGLLGSPPLQFIRGISEPTVPDVKLTRAKDGSSGTATFVFAEPSVFEASEDLGDITGLYMRDAEGELSTVDVQVVAAPALEFCVACGHTLIYLVKLPRAGWSPQ